MDLHSLSSGLLNLAAYLPLILLALCNMKLKESVTGITLQIGKMEVEESVTFAYQFPAFMPIIDIEIKSKADHHRAD
ncbi:hypothetical protein DZF79_28735 [Vibrio parahaemolyticus]|nr:hypothetical protein [Vibrio parahaemolyticus]